MPDPWEEAAKQFKGAAPQGGQPQSATAPNEDWKMWAGSDQPQAEQPGFLESLGDTFGINPKNTAQQLSEHPIRSIIEQQPPVQALEGIYSGGKRILGELGDAYHSAREGNVPGAAAHAIQAIPFIGEGIKRGSEQMGPFNGMGEGIKEAATNPGVLGTIAGTAATTAPLVAGGVDAALPGRSPIGRIPTRAHAGQVLESVKNRIGNQPVSLTRSLPVLERAQQLSERGHGTIGALDNLYKRANTTNPLDYAEARDRASAISSLTGQDKMAATKTLQREAKNFSHAFNDDIGDTAAQHGLGDEYSKGMKEYRRASQIRNGLIKTAKYGGPALVGGGLAAKVIRELLP